MSTAHNLKKCSEGAILAGIRTTSLVISESKIKEVEDICRKYEPVITVSPLRECKVGAIVAGDEILEGRIEDKVMETIQKEVENLGSKMFSEVYCTDNAYIVAEAIKKLKDQGCELILAVAEMSKDPDDVTPASIKRAGASIECYGAPVLPGSMFLIAYLDDMPILGVPAWVVHDERTILDIILPRILAGEKVNKIDIIKLGHGGLCLQCYQCTYPICPFGKGW